MADKSGRPEDAVGQSQVFSKEEHKREVNRLRSIKKQRAMKMVERTDDVVPSPGRTSLSVESINNDVVTEPGTDTINYLNQLIGEESMEKPPTVHTAAAGWWKAAMALFVIFLAVIIAFYLKK